VHGGYAALSQESSGFPMLLTALLTVLVAILGYRLLLGRAQLQVGDLVLTAAKVGIVLALATRWDTYQLLVSDFLFDGPQHLANAMIAGVQSGGAAPTNIFEGLEQAIAAMQLYAANYAQQAPPQVSPLLGGAGFGAFSLNLSATLLLLFTVGVLLVAKIVLGLLLAVGPIFLALLLFASTRGLFEGWLRACIAFALTPLATVMLLGFMLLMLEPLLVQIGELQARNEYDGAAVQAVFTLVLACGGVSAGMLVASAMIAGGLRLPAMPTPIARAETREVSPAAMQSRADRIVAAVASMERRATASLAEASATFDRRPRRTTPHAIGDDVIDFSALRMRANRRPRPKPRATGEGA